MFASVGTRKFETEGRTFVWALARWTAIVLAVALFGACAHTQPSAVPMSTGTGPSEAYTRAVVLEREAAKRTVQLDRKVGGRLADERDRQLQLDLKSKKSVATASPLSEPRALVPREDEQQLLQADISMNRALEGLYTTAWKNVSGEDELRAALLHWTVLLRRTLMQDFHTRVPGLEEDPDCAGDIVGDGLLQRYFDAVLAHEEAGAALALADLARQSACLGVDQSKQLAGALVSAFDELRVFLRLHGHEDLVPYVVQAGSGPLLLFYDVEKYRGTDAPLSRWFHEHRDILIEGVESGRQPSRWHGLWLYDRRTGRLFGFKATARPVDENDVNLSRFFASITTLENLGTANCSFAEMVERGMGAMGYLCAGSTCGRVTAGRRPVAFDMHSRKTALDILGLNAVEKTFDLAICGTAGDSAGDHGPAPKCGDDAALGGRAADTIRCITSQVVHAGTEGFHCLGEAAGQCSDPLGSLVKNFQPQQMAGIKLGIQCTVASGTGSKTSEREKEQKERKEQQARDNEIERLKKLIQTYEQAQAEDKQLADEANTTANKDYLNYKDAKKAAEDAGRDPAQEPIVMEAKAKAEKSAQKAQAAADATNATRRLAEQLKEKAKQDLEKKQKEDEQKKEEKRKEQEKKAQEAKKKPVSRCVRDNPNCGDDECSAMSQATRDTLACVAGALSGEKSPPRTPGSGCDPTNCDPIEPSATGAGTLACFDAIGNEAGAAASKRCWAMRCAEGQVPVGGTNGCTCQAGGGLAPTQSGGGMANFCTRMLCSEGAPVYRDGHCTCGGESGGNLGSDGRIDKNLSGYGGPIPKKMEPVIGGATPYSDFHYGRP